MKKGLILLLLIMACGSAWSADSTEVPGKWQTVLETNLAAAQNPFLGDWALTIPGGAAGWLGIRQNGDQLQASMLWGWGSVFPLDSATLENGRLVLTRKYTIASTCSRSSRPGYRENLLRHEQRMPRLENFREMESSFSKRILPAAELNISIERQSGFARRRAAELFPQGFLPP